jgi:hypothetical protein
MLSWIAQLNKYDNVYLITGFHEIQIFLEHYNERSNLNLIVIPENSDIDIFLSKVISNADIARMRDIPLGVAYWDLSGNSHSFLNKFFFQTSVIVNILIFRYYLITNLKKNIETNLYIYAYINNIQYYIFEKYFRSASTGQSIIYQVPKLNQISLIKNPKLNKKIMKFIYSSVSGVEMELYKTKMYIAFGSKFFISAKSSIDPWPFIIKKFGIELPIVDQDSALIIDGPIQTLIGVNYKESISRLEKYINMSMKSKNIFLKPHYNHNFGTFDKSEMLSNFKIIPKGFPVEIYMHLFSKIFFFTSSAISSCKETTEATCLLNILVYKDEISYSENIKIMNDSVSDKISRISFAELS